MKVGVIGAGRWGINIVRTLNEMGVLGGVAEGSESARAALADKVPGVSVFSTHGELLQSDIGAVAIATPVPTHVAVGLDAIAAGKHVFVEKPLALTVAEGRQLVEAAQSAGKTLMVGHLLMYQPAIAWIRQALADGLIGTLRLMQQERLGLGKARSAENALWSLGVHDVAIALHLARSPVVRVRAAGIRVLQPTVEDDVAIEMDFESGVQGRVHSSWLWPEKRRRLSLIGDAGMLVYDEAAQCVMHHRKRIDVNLNNVDEGESVVFEGESKPLTLEMAHFLECIESGKQPLSDGANALSVLAVLEQADVALRN